ncbi:MAG: DUF3108 domain-containing protein [Candidatus Omnitrophota bacterium]
MKNILVLSIFILAGILAVSPIINDFSGKVFGEPNDALVTVWHFWWLQTAHDQGVSELKIPIVSAPFGADYSRYPYYPVWNFINMHLSCAIGEVAAYNIQILLGFILSGLAMYYFIFFLTKNMYASVLTGLILTFSPYHFSHAFEHLGLSNMQWLVFYMLSLFNFLKKPSYISAVLCGILFAVIGFFDYYYLYFAGIFSAVLFIYYCFYYYASLRKKIFKNWQYLILGVLVSAVLLFPSLFHIAKFLIIKSPETSVIVTDYARPFGQLFADSARILNYILPAYFHPILGWITRPFIGTFLYGDNPPEQTLYLGWFGLLFAYFWVKKWRFKKNRVDPNIKDIDFASRFFLFAFFAFIIFSFPPYLSLGKIFIPFPSFFLYKSFSMFRNYARIGIFVLISMCVLAGYGLAYFIENFSGKKKLGVIILLGSLICFEFLPYPPQKVVDATTVAPVYAWLSKQQGDFIVVEYPIDADERPYLFSQRYHKKRLINGIIPGTKAAAVRKKIIDINAEKTAGILGFLGAKYLVMHEDKYTNYEGGVILGQIPDLRANRGYVLVKDFGNEKIYEITAKAVDPENVVENNNNNQSSPDRSLEDNNFGFTVGDKFSYSIKYLGLVPLLDVYVEVKKARGEKNLVIEADAKAKGIIAKFMDIDIKLKSMINKDATIPLAYTQSIRMRKDTKLKDVVFDREQLVMLRGDRKVSINKYTQDPLSAIFYIAAFDFNHVRKFDVFINPGKTNYKLRAEVVGKTQKKAFKRKMDCWEIKGEYFSLKGKQEKIASVKMWFLNDKAKPLVRMEVLTKAGFITVEKNTEN